MPYQLDSLSYFSGKCTLQRFYTCTPLMWSVYWGAPSFHDEETGRITFQLAQRSAFCISIWLFFSSRIPSPDPWSLPWTPCLYPCQIIPWMLRKVVDLNLHYSMLCMAYTFLSYHKYLSLAPFLPRLWVPLVIFMLFREWLFWWVGCWIFFHGIASPPRSLN